MKNYVVFGGTFDPVHNGHLRIAQKASEKLNASIIFVPSKAPRWKNPLETSNHRLEMLKIALRDVKFEYEICDYELKSDAEVNYSIDTIKYLKNLHKQAYLYLLKPGIRLSIS